MTINYKKQILYLLVLLIMLIFAPFYIRTTTTHLFIEVFYLSLFAMSLNLLMGYGGMLSFGQSTYFGIGAYASALVMLHIKGIGLILTVLIAGFSAAIVGAFFAIFLVRVSGTAFAMLTMAFMQICYTIALKWREVTGGDDGLSGFSVPNITVPFVGKVNMTESYNLYWFILIVTIALIAITRHLLQTPLGRAIVLLKESPSRSGFIGHRISLNKYILLTYSSFVAGIAGSLFVLFQELVATSSIDMMRSIDPILMCVIGGIGTFAGPMVGALIMTSLSHWLSGITSHWPFFLGCIFVAMVLWLRGGIMGIVSTAWNFMKSRKSGELN